MIIDDHLKQIVEATAAAKEAELKYIRLYKPEGSSLGFSVVGLKSENKGELGIYVQEIQPHGVAGKDGQLQEGDQILAIDGNLLDRNIKHQQAIEILQKARGTVDLILLRNPTDPEPDQPDQVSKQPKEDPGVPSDWCQVEVIELVNNGSGLGFGIIGGQQAGVIVKTILPDGVADQDGRLRPNDYILQINEHWLPGVGSERVAVVLRSAGNQVKLVVARPVDLNDPAIHHSHVPIVQSALLTNRNELERQLQQYKSKRRFDHLFEHKYYFFFKSICFILLHLFSPHLGTPDMIAPPPSSFGPMTNLANDMILPQESEKVSIQHKPSRSIDQTTSPIKEMILDNNSGANTGSVGRTAPTPAMQEMMPEMITLDVELIKDSKGLGVTIAGYTCEREELSGIFIKSVTEGSAAHRSGKVMVHDQIVEVDGRSIQGYTNQQAVEMLRSTGQTVRLKLIRYVRGLKFEQLQQAIANSQANSSPRIQHHDGPPPLPPQMIRTDSVVSEEDASAKEEEQELPNFEGMYLGSMMGCAEF